MMITMVRMIMRIDDHGATSSWLLTPKVARGLAGEYSSFLGREGLDVIGIIETNLDSLFS